MRTTRSHQYLPRLFVLSLFVSLALAGAPAASGGAVSAQTPVQDPAAARAQIAWPMTDTPRASMSAAAKHLLGLVQTRADDAAVSLGSTLIVENPNDAPLHALYALSLAGIGLWTEALEVDKQHLVRWPNDAWARVVHGYLLREPARTDDAVAAATLARQLAPRDADIAREAIRIYAAHLQYDQAIALADSFITSGRGTDLIHLEKYNVFQAMTFLPGRRDTSAARRADAALALALAENSHSAATHLAAGERHLWDRRPTDALPLLERAVSLSPISSPIRRAYWRGISAQADIPAAERRALIHTDMDAFLKAWEHRVEARFTVATHLYQLRDTVRLIPMWDLIQSEHAGTWQAAKVTYDRALLGARSGWEQATTNADSMRVTHVLRDALQPITSMPGANSIVLGSAYSQLFRILEQDSTSSADELFSVFERYEQQYPWPPPSRRHSIIPVALAERGSRLDLAEELARAGLEPREDFLAWQQVYYTVAEYADEMDWVKADYHATIGWVLFHKGEIAEAKRELEQAHEILNTAPAPPYRLGRIAEAEGDIKEAERWYATGRGRENWNRRSSEALERIYLARHESLDGFDEYLGAIDERDLERRRAKVESERIADPEPLPNFEHNWMNGGRFSSDSLKGKVAVINFWGVWCGPCVREAPDIQKFAEKFSDHQDVVFITVANDVDLDVTRDFMKEKGYDFPVIFDEGLVGLANIYAFPTTLFVDRDGRIVFSLIGANLHLVEEYTWRVEALLGRPVADAGEARSADTASTRAFEGATP